MSSTIQDKTIRPGGLRYTYYQSGVVDKKVVKEPPKKHRFRNFLVLLIILVAIPFIYNAAHGSANASHKTATSPAKSAPTTLTTKTKKKTTTATSPAVAVAPNACASNTLPQLILVSISQQHLWACDGSTVLYNSSVVTGDEQYADTLTPPGTYHIYGKETDKTLTGKDENGSWNDFVYYWMPFLYNQYGAYGLHDATWRTPNEFGNININTSKASNGCVELPLATAKWLYNWDEIGTTVTIES